MFKNQISSVIKQAFTTFSCKQDLFHQNLEILKSMLEKTTAADVNLHPEFLSDTLWNHPKKAPATYIDIFENEKFTVGIFILKPGMKLPLHNHPDMYGLIKLILGKIKITSYSINTLKTKEIATRSHHSQASLVAAAAMNLFSTRKPSTMPIVVAEKQGSDEVDINSDCCMVEPEKGNLHELECVDGPAAFIDILAPPYETEIPGGGRRTCSYYAILSQVTNDVFKLQEICAPSWYWSDSYPYSGPDISDAICS